MTDDQPILTIPRIYTDDDGVTRFDDVVVTGRPGQSPVSTAQAIHAALWKADSVQFRRIVTEDTTGNLHNAPARQLAIQLAGDAEYRVSSGEVRRVPQGGIILLDDVEGGGHTASNAGDVPRVSLFIKLDANVDIE